MIKINHIFNTPPSIFLITSTISLFMMIYYHRTVEDNQNFFRYLSSITIIIISLIIVAVGLHIIISRNNYFKRLKQANQELTEIQHRYQILYDLSPDLYSTLDLNDIRIDCNNSYANKLGYNKEELIGKTIYSDQHLSDEDKDRARQILRQAKNGISTLNQKFQLSTRNGLIVPVSLSCVPIHDKDGKITGTNALMRDLTNFYEAKEKDLSEKLTRLEYEALKKIDKQKEEFISMISHELKTPLVPIRGYCDMLKTPNLLGSLNKEQIEAIYEILDSCNKAEKIISNVLDVQKLELDQVKFKKDLFVIDDLITETSKKFLPIITQKNITLVKANSDLSMMMVSDKQRLFQVLGNFIINAIDFVPEKGGKIEIGTQKKDDQITFYVKDNGMGISKEKLSRLFHKFYQVDTSNRKVHKGSGLGLSICKSIIEKLHGKIWVESEIGVGSTFYFSLPMKMIIDEAFENE